MKKKSRKCTMCKNVLLLEKKNFHSSKTKRFNGFAYKCKSCSRKRDIKRHQKRKEYFIEYQRKWCKDNSEKVLASNLLRLAIKKGKIKRLPCEICGNEKSHGHHDDYSKPYKVRWLCAKHHRALHESIKI